MNAISVHISELWKREPVGLSVRRVENGLFFENGLSNLQILAVGLIRLVGALDLRVALVGQRNAGARVARVNLKRKLPF